MANVPDFVNVRSSAQYLPLAFLSPHTFPSLLIFLSIVVVSSFQKMSCSITFIGLLNEASGGWGIDVMCFSVVPK